MTGQPEIEKDAPLELLTVGQVSEVLKLSRGALYQMIARREIPFIKMGRRVRFASGDIAGWLNRQKIKESDKAGNTGFYLS